MRIIVDVKLDDSATDAHSMRRIADELKGSIRQVVDGLAQMSVYVESVSAWVEEP